MRTETRTETRTGTGTGTSLFRLRSTRTLLVAVLLRAYFSWLACAIMGDPHGVNGVLSARAWLSKFSSDEWACNL